MSRRYRSKNAPRVIRSGCWISGLICCGLIGTPLELGIGGNPSSGAVTGVVHVCTDGEESEPIEGMVVQLTSPTIMPGPVLKTNTASDGSFNILNVPSGVYWVKVSALGYATARATIYVQSGETAQLDLFVGGGGFDLRPSWVQTNVGETVELSRHDHWCNPLRFPEDYHWTSSDEAIATISAAGVATGIAVGTAMISATSETSGLTATAVVSVADAAPGFDQIVLVDNKVCGGALPSEPETVVLVDGYSEADGGCINDLVRTDDLTFANLKPSAENCDPAYSDEVVVFSVDDSVVLDEGDPLGKIWTNNEDVRFEELGQGLLSVPIVVWLTQEYHNSELVSVIAQADIERSSVFYNTSRAGVKFDVQEIIEVWNDQAALDDIGAICSPTVVSEQFTPGVLNVYYVDEIIDQPTDTVAHVGPDSKGVHCDWVEWNIIYISLDDREDATLAHELGHAFGLEHTCEGSTPFRNEPFKMDDGAGYFDETNIMWACDVPPDNRSSLSLGQVFRINFNWRSAVIRNGLRDAPVRYCGCGLGDPGCPFHTWKAQAETAGICPTLYKTW